MSSDITTSDEPQVGSQNSRIPMLKAVPAISSTADDRSHLLFKLHRSLELEQVIRTFFQTIQEEVCCDGLTFQNSRRGITYQQGQQEKHRLDYLLYTADDMLGELRLTRKSSFSDAETALLDTLARCLVQPLANALCFLEAVNAALTDPLTGLRNRLDLEKILLREMQNARRRNENLSLLMIDINSFKLLNDKFGHVAGDVAIKKVADAIKHCVRETDFVFRYGGDEFLVILPGSDAEQAAMAASRITILIDCLAAPTIKDMQMKISVSVGYYTLENEIAAHELINETDKVLAKIKSLYHRHSR